MRNTVKTYEEKKKILCSYSNIEGRIKELESELEDLWSKSTNISPSLNGMPKCSGGESRVEIAAERIERLETLIEKERDELEAIRYRISSAIKALSNITERRIIYLKYIDKENRRHSKTVPLWKIANKLGYSIDYINHKHNEALKHLKL